MDPLGPVCRGWGQLKNWWECIGSLISRYFHNVIPRFSTQKQLAVVRLSVGLI